MTQEYKGKSVYKGIALGPVVVFQKNDVQVKREKITDAEGEIARMQDAVSASQEQLQKLYDKAVKEVGEASAAIFEVHQMMLEDEDYQDAICNMIRNEMVNAEYAVAVTGDNFAEMFASMMMIICRRDPQISVIFPTVSFRICPVMHRWI